MGITSQIDFRYDADVDPAERQLVNSIMGKVIACDPEKHLTVA